MARLWSCGFELNTTTVQVEIDRTNSGSFSTISTSTVRSGAYSMRFSGFSGTTNQANGFNFQTLGSANVYARAYFNFATFPGGATPWCVMSLAGSVGSGNLNIVVTSSGVIRLYQNSTQVGSDGPTLSTGVWYRFELHFNNTGAGGTHIAEAMLDGVSFVSVSSLTLTSIAWFNVGRISTGSSSTSAVGDYFVDDMALNDTTGSFQTSWPGSGKIIHLRPNAAGDSTAWTRAGTDTGANYSQVNEVTPDDVTTYITSTTLNQEDFYNVDDSGIGVSDTVNLIGVGVRFSGSSSVSEPTFRVEAKKTTGGTISQGSAIVPQFTTWVTNHPAGTLRLYPLVLYQDPDSSNWTQSTLDTMQIGVKLTVDNTNSNQISTLWALVDYTPGTIVDQTIYQPIRIANKNVGPPALRQVFQQPYISSPPVAESAQAAASKLLGLLGVG
jgi:hypothetical protein